MNGSPLEVLVSAVAAVVGIYCLACALEGYIWTAPIDMLGRILSAVAALCLISPNTLTDVIGIVLLVIVHVTYIAKFKRHKAHAVS